MTSLNENDDNSFHCLNDTSSPDVDNATTFALGNTNKITYATSSESDHQSNPNPLKTASLQHSGKNAYKSNGRRRTLAPIRFGSNHNSSSISSSSLSNDPHDRSKSRFEYGSGRSSDDSESNKKAKVERETNINQDATADNRCKDYQQSSENRENIPPTETAFFTPITQMKEIVLNHATTLSSLSNQTTDSQLEINHDKCSIQNDDDENNRIKILSTSANLDQIKASNLDKHNSNDSLSSSVNSSESSGYKTGTEDEKLNTNNGLRRSKRIRNRKQKATESQESSSAKETNMIKGRKREKECASQPPLIQQSDGPFENVRQPTLSTDEKSVDVKALSRTLEHNLSISDQCLIKSSTIKSIALDESPDVDDMKKIQSMNRGGRRRSLRLSKRTLDIEPVDKLKKSTHDVSNDTSSELVSCTTFGSTKKSELHLEIDDDHHAENKVKQNTTRRRRSMRSTKGIIPERFRDRNAPSSQIEIKSKETFPDENDRSKENVADGNNTSEPMQNSSLHQAQGESTEFQTIHVVNKSVVKKRRRRSSLGLHAGGLISVQDIERIEKEAIARKKRRDYEIQNVNEKSNSTIKCSPEGSTTHISSPTSKAMSVGLSSNLIQNFTNEGNNTTDNQFKIKEDSRKKNEYIPTADDILQKVKIFLQSSDINSKPCMSARLFACVLLKHEQEDKQFNSNTIHSLLQAFVDAEMSSLKDTKIAHNFSKKKLHFCSTNNSSMISPIDTEEHSECVIENCIESYHNILKESQIVSNESESTKSLRAFITSLQEMNGISLEENSCFVECSKTMPCCWPKRRFKTVGEYYLSEFKYISFSNRENISQTRQCLGDIIGRAIRFYLRRFFNPVPISLHSYSNSEQPDYDFSRSIVHTMIELTDNEQQRDTAVADGSISSVVSLAILRISEFNDFTGWFNSDSKLKMSFCNRLASMRGIECRGSVITLDENDIEEVLTDIDESHIVLAGIRACKFFLTLMKWNGIQEAIDEIGGWKKVENFSQIFAENKLENEVPDEKHLHLLQNVEQLVTKIEADIENFSQLEEQCDDSLRRLWKKFRCGTKNKQLLKLNPGIKIIQTCLKAGAETFFPAIVSVQI